MMFLSSQINNPMSEYLFKLQLIVKASEFKNKEEANKYETLESKENGDKYVRAILGEDMFESYTYDEDEIRMMLIQVGYPDNRIDIMMTNSLLLPSDVRNYFMKQQRQLYISQYEEKNKYYYNLTGKPFMGDENTPADDIIYIPDGFYDQYKDDLVISKGQPIHELPEKYQELFIDSEYYKQTLDKYPNAIYLRYIGSNSIPIEVSRRSRDGDIMKINERKLHAYHHSYGNVTVDSTIIHAFSNIYKSTRDYIYNTLRGDFANIYANYNSLIRFLTIYMAIGSALNEFQKKSAKLIYMNNTTANNYFMLYGLPSVIMEGTPKVEFLKKFRMLLMDKGTNTVYRVKDMIGYEYTDIYTLIMVKQQVFENGIPIYHYNADGTKTPVTNIVFRRFGTAETNSSYFDFRENKREYSLEEITSGDPRWWGGKEVDAMLEDMNYTLSNSKYIQLSTHMSMTDIWWQCTIFLRGLLDRKNETSTFMLNTDKAIDNKASIMLYDAVLSLIVMMHWHLKDAFGNSFAGHMYVPDAGMWYCIDKLFNGLTGLTPNPLKDGGPYKVASFNFGILYDAMYSEIIQYKYLNPSIFVPMLNKILNRENSNVGDALMRDIKLLYKYLETKLQQARTIHEFRQVVDTFKALFLVEPIRNWYGYGKINTDESLSDKYEVSINEINQLKLFFKPKGSVISDEGVDIGYDFIIEHLGKSYTVYLYDVMNNDVNKVKINDEYIFRDAGFVTKFNKMMSIYSKNLEVQASNLSPKIRKWYRQLIIDKVSMDLGNTIYGPNTFENLLMMQNPSLYNYIIQQKNEGDDSVLLVMRSIIQALEEYSNSSLAGLQLKALGSDEYFRILKEVITYFKSYMVEFTKEELTFIFGGLFDNGGNSDMVNLYDEITSGVLEATPYDSLTLFDVSYADTQYNMPDDGLMTMRDEVLFRLRTAYKNVLNSGYEIWYDNKKRITQKPSFAIDDDTEVIANIVKANDTYKIIINIENVDNGYPPGYYGNTI